MTIPDDCRNPRPRPWWADGEFASLARERYERRHESPLRWGEWLNVRDEVRAEIAGGAQYPADVEAMVEEDETMLTIHQGDNLDYLRGAVERGERFDLVEIDGPYGQGLEGWDCLSEAEYVTHYAERLALVRQVLQPWGVVEMFGYPEMVALVRAWAAETGTLHLRRWVTWYKQVTAHKGRKVEVVAVFSRPDRPEKLPAFKVWLRDERQRRSLTITQAMALTDARRHLAGKGCGMMWFEAESSDIPQVHEYWELKSLFGVPDEFDDMTTYARYEGITDLDYIGKTYAERTAGLNDAGLRSKPIGLYLDIFRPVVPPREHKRALVLYGGSGNAAIAAARLGYDVTVCEADAARCDLIRRNFAQRIEHSLEGLPMFEGLEAA